MPNLWKLMPSKLQTLFSDAKEHWLVGVVISLIVFFTLILGLMLRYPYVAKVKVEIGGVYFDSAGLMQFKSYQTSNDIESFYMNHVFKLPIFPRNSCEAVAVSYVEGLQLQTILTCRAKTEEQSRELIHLATKLLLDRHKIPYEMSKKAAERQKNSIELEILERKRILELMRTEKNNVLIQVDTINQQIRIKQLQDKLVDLQVLPVPKVTQIDGRGISVLDRRPNLIIWTIVLLLTISSGILATAIFSRLNRINA